MVAGTGVRVRLDDPPVLERVVGELRPGQRRRRVLRGDVGGRASRSRAAHAARGRRAGGWGAVPRAGFRGWPYVQSALPAPRPSAAPPLARHISVSRAVRPLRGPSPRPPPDDPLGFTTLFARSSAPAAVPTARSSPGTRAARRRGRQRRYAPSTKATTAPTTSTPAHIGIARSEGVVELRRRAVHLRAHAREQRQRGHRDQPRRAGRRVVDAAGQPRLRGRPRTPAPSPSAAPPG